MSRWRCPLHYCYLYRLAPARSHAQTHTLTHTLALPLTDGWSVGAFVGASVCEFEIWQQRSNGFLFGVHSSIAVCLLLLGVGRSSAGRWGRRWLCGVIIIALPSLVTVTATVVAALSTQCWHVEVSRAVGHPRRRAFADEPTTQPALTRDVKESLGDWTGLDWT